MNKTTNHRSSGTPSGIRPGALVLRLRLERYRPTLKPRTAGAEVR